MSAADDLRAMMLQIGHETAVIEPRGYDSIQRRNALYAQWDDLYEDFLLETAVEMTTTDTATATGEQTP
jgi:hypothetical protein